MRCLGAGLRRSRSGSAGLLVLGGGGSDTGAPPAPHIIHLLLQEWLLLRLPKQDVRRSPLQSRRFESLDHRIGALLGPSGRFVTKSVPRTLLRNTTVLGIVHKNRFYSPIAQYCRNEVSWRGCFCLFPLANPTVGTQLDGCEDSITPHFNAPWPFCTLDLTSPTNAASMMS